MGTLVTDVKPGTMNFKHLVFAVLLSTLALTYGSTINEDKCEACEAEQKQAFADCKDDEEPKKCVVEEIKEICSKEEYKDCPTCSKPEGECKKCAEAQKEAVEKCKKDDGFDKKCAAAEEKAIAECKKKDDPKKCAIDAIKTICNKDQCKDCKTCSKPKDWCPICAKGAEIAKKTCGEDEDCYEEKMKMICSKKPCMECKDTCPQKELEKDWCPACKKAVDWGMKKCKKAKYPKKCAIKTWRGICWKDECKGCCRNLSFN